MEQRSKRVCKRLSNLSCGGGLKYEALPVIEKLTADLIEAATEGQRKCKKGTKDFKGKCVEPCECDNEDLVKNLCNLQIEFVQFRRQNKTIQEDLKRHLYILGREKLECDRECDKLRKRIHELEIETANKTNRIFALENSTQTEDKNKLRNNFKLISRSKCCSNIEASTSLALAQQKINDLVRKMKYVEEDRTRLSEINEMYKNQLANRDREIERLNSTLEGEIRIHACNQHCRNKSAKRKVHLMQQEISSLEKAKSELEYYLKEAVIKQHEAMERAVCLVERNAQLEKELYDVDQMALAEESDCNALEKKNAGKIRNLQEQVHESISQIQGLEGDIAELKFEKKRLLVDLDSVRSEKNRLQKTLETALEEKKKLNDKINQINLEIDTLGHISATSEHSKLDTALKLSEKAQTVVTDHTKGKGDGVPAPFKKSERYL